VPTATQHTAAEAEDSADWIGIGGGCVDSGCTVTDSTLIQTGTEQDVSSTGAASYDAWYELVPAPEFEISDMTIEPGDSMHASISEVVNDANVWTITIQDATVNGASADLQSSEQMDLVDSNGDVIGAPSSPRASGSRWRR
jgi:Peptidase A4 family